ncbi:SaV-like protein [Lactococcus phage PLG-II]|nr:SaV-like protein [Lactococcus phage PLG-II]
MNYRENQHYVNKHGQQLKHFMIEKFGLEEYKIWCKLNAFKYQSRAGKKEGNSFLKDLKKRNDYIDEVFETETMREFLAEDLSNLAEEFEEWKGK